MARLIATPIIKFGTPTNALLGSCPKTGAGPELDKNSPFITRETKFNFETMMQNSLSIPKEKNRAEDFETMTQDSLPIQEEKNRAEDFETMTQNSLPIQEEKSRAEDTEKEDPMDVCDEQSKSIETADVPLSNNKNIDIIASVHEELEYRVAQLKALPTPERKRILGLDNVKTEIPMLTPFKNNNGASSVKQSPSSTKRFTQVHEKNFSKMPSIATH